MTRLLHGAPRLLLLLFALALLPLTAAAEEIPTQTVSIQVNISAPSGASIIGTIVARRTGGAGVTTELSFTGMMNGAPASMKGTAVERWTGDNQSQLQLTSITEWHAAVAQPSLLTLDISQSSPDVFYVNGVVFAIDHALQAPFGDRNSYVITMPGQGTSQIKVLPNTGDGPGITPLMIVGLLIGPGIVLVLLGSLLRKGTARRSSAGR
jgi:hypothetical protein